MLCKYILICSFVVLLSFNNTASAQASPIQQAFNCKHSLSAEASAKLLSDAQNEFTKLQSLRADFYQDSYLMALDESELSAGKVRLKKPGKMRWDYNTPEEQIFIIMDKDIWLYQPRLNQVMIDTLDQVLISQLPTAFLMGVGDLSKDFKIQSGCTTKESALLVLIPAADSGDAANLSQFELLLDQHSSLPIGAKITDLAGNKTAILLKSLVINDKSILEADFNYEFGKDLDIDDRRKGTALKEIQ